MGLLNLFNFMPQFDIASFYPQITFFVGIFLMFYAYVDKNVLPKTGQNLKLRNKLFEIYTICVGKGFEDVNLLVNIYDPSRVIFYAALAEMVYIVHSLNFIKILTQTYISVHARSWRKNSQRSLLRLNVLYLTILADVL